MLAIVDGGWRGANYTSELRPDAVAVLAWDDLRREAAAAGATSDPGETPTPTWDDLMAHATAGDLAAAQAFMGWGGPSMSTEPFYASQSIRRKRKA